MITQISWSDVRTPLASNAVIIARYALIAAVYSMGCVNNDLLKPYRAAVLRSWHLCSTGTFAGCVLDREFIK